MARVQQAREALGQQLRELRREANLSGTGLAGLLGWPQSKVSKIENGRQTPTEADVTAWARVTGAPQAADGLIAKLRTLETMYAEWRRQLRTGTRAKQQSILERESRATVMRAFEPAVVPGLLQTPDYARRRLAQSVRRHGVPDDVDEGVRVRMQRQEILYRADKRFHFVVTEATLRYRLCPVEVLMGQLERLVALTAMRNLRLGIIPFDVELTESPKHGFWIVDDKAVYVETVAAELTLAQPQEIALYTQAFNRFASVAVYGSEARAVLTRVLDDLAAATD